MGQNHIGTYAQWAPLAGRTPGEGANGFFFRCVGPVTCVIPTHCRGAGEVNNVSLTLFQHQWLDQLHQFQGGDRPDTEALLKGVQAELHQWPGLGRHCVIHEDIETTKGVVGVCHEGVQRVQVADIALQRSALGTKALRDLRTGLLTFLQSSSHGDHPHAAFGQRQGNTLSHSLARAGNERHFLIEWNCHESSPSVQSLLSEVRDA